MDSAAGPAHSTPLGRKHHIAAVQGSAAVLREMQQVTPDAVIYRYLQIISADVVDVDSLCRLLSADADLLARWLQLLDLPADGAALRERIEALSKDEFDGLAQAQAWTVLPVAGSARLSTGQWMSVLNAAFLAEVLLENLYQPQTGYEPASGLDTRLRVLLGISGVQLSQDRQLNQLSEFRGTPPELLEDAALELRIFAVVDGLEFGREAELAETLLQLPGSRFQDLVSIAQGRARQLVNDLGIDVSSDTDWSHRIWLRQQIVVITTALAHARDWEELVQLHALVSRCLFVRPPLLLRHHVSDGILYWQDGISINTSSKTSRLAQAMRDKEAALVTDSGETAVVDRQLLKVMDAEQALAVPVPGGSSLLLVADDDELDAGAAAQLYAEQLARYIPQAAVAGAADEDAEPAENGAEALLAEFRAQETQRLREVVHEANNPLSIVHNYLHILELRLQHEPEAVEQLALISAELNRAGEVFASAREIPELAAAPVAAGEGETDLLELGAWLSDVVELHSGYAMDNGVTLHPVIESQGLQLHTDRNKLTQIISNLIKNAIEACGIGGAVKAGCRDGVVRSGLPGYELYVEDNGPGIEQETLMNIAAVKESAKGGEHQGVGLHLCFRLSTELGAALDVQTQKDRGTTFKLFLPVAAESP